MFSRITNNKDCLEFPNVKGILDREQSFCGDGSPQWVFLKPNLFQTCTQGYLEFEDTGEA